MNSITIAGYIANLEQTKDAEGKNKIKFAICDKQSDTSKMWFNCYLTTKSEKYFDYLQRQKAAKQQITIIGSMFYNFQSEHTYINVLVKNLC